MDSKYIIKTIYIGGGTPSYVDSNLIKHLLEIIDFKNAEEITIEINPGTVTKEKLQDYFSAGINRLSIGLQSTNDEILKTIGRIHNYSVFLESYNLARNVGFKNINVDLMLGLPNQSIEILEESLKNVIELNPNHISLYSLILEEGTVLFNKVKNGSLVLPSEDLERTMYWKTQKILEDNGYIQYEISNFAQNGFESKHNLDCWNQKEYIGIGAAAHSYLDLKRYSNCETIEKYIDNYNEKIIHEIQDKLSQEKEYMILGLRKLVGLKISDFKNKFTDNPLYIFRNELNKLVKQNLIEIDLNNIKLTKEGLDFANLVWQEFI